MRITATVPLNLISCHRAYHRGTSTCLAFNPSGDLLASAAQDGVVLFFEVPTGRPLLALELDTNHTPISISWRDDFHFWLGSSDGSLTLWSIVRTAGNLAQLKAIDALPVYFPSPPMVVCIKREAAACWPFLVVGFNNSFEVWEHRTLIRSSWEPRGHATSLGSANVLAAWPLRRDTVVVVFRDRGARVWKFKEDRLIDLVGWPDAVGWDLAELISTDNFAAQLGERRSDISGHIVLIGGGTLYVLALSLQPIPHVTQHRSISLAPSMQPQKGLTTTWSGLPIFVVSNDGDLEAFDLSAMAFQNATSAKLMLGGSSGNGQQLSLSDLCIMKLQPVGLRVTTVAAFSGPLGWHVAAAFPSTDGHWSVAVWSATDAAVGSTSSPRPDLVPKVRFHSEIQRLVIQFHRKQGRYRTTWGKSCIILLSAILALLVGSYLSEEFGLPPPQIAQSMWQSINQGESHESAGIQPTYEDFGSGLFDRALALDGLLPSQRTSPRSPPPLAMCRPLHR